MQPHVQEFHDDLRKALAQPIKRISPKYFYDAQGSALFDQICELPEYYPTRTEFSILSRHAQDIAQQIGPKSELIELGAGSLTKVRCILRALEAATSFVPMDISGEHLMSATQSLQQEFSALKISPIVADYTKDWRLPPQSQDTRRRVAFFPGSTLGNFSPLEVEQFFANCARHLPSGGLLLGVDLLKQPEIIHQAYNDAQGVTAAFNLNLLARANRQLHTNFALNQFAHWAFYNAPKQRIEMHLVSLQKQKIMLGNTDFVFEEGETLHTENSYKFSLSGIQALAQKQGLQPGPVWTDARRWFGLLWFDLPEKTHDERPLCHAKNLASTPRNPVSDDLACTSLT